MVSGEEVFLCKHKAGVQGHLSPVRRLESGYVRLHAEDGDEA